MARPAARGRTRDGVDRLGANQTDSREFRAEVLDHLRRVVGFDWYAWLRVRQARTLAVVASARDRGRSGPSVILMDDDLRIVGQTGASLEWLHLLLPNTGGMVPIPASAYDVAAQLLARQHGVDGHEPIARTHLADGLRVTLRASRVEPGDLIAATIEPVSPGHRLDLFARANALSARERERLALLTEGADTVEAASRMFLSPHTVQDHLKSVLAKTGTRNRRVLLSHALGVRGDADARS